MYATNAKVLVFETLLIIKTSMVTSQEWPQKKSPQCQYQFAYFLGFKENYWSQV
jgi:hypothetical protein